MLEGAQTGMPHTRPLLLEYPEDEAARVIKDQFMLGSEIMMAPVFKNNTDTRAVYMPAGHWVRMWTQEEYSFETGQHLQVKTPIGLPAVFVKGENRELIDVIESANGYKKMEVNMNKLR